MSSKKIIGFVLLAGAAALAYYYWKKKSSSAAASQPAGGSQSSGSSTSALTPTPATSGTGSTTLWRHRQSRFAPEQSRNGRAIAGDFAPRLRHKLNRNRRSAPAARCSRSVNTASQGGLPHAPVSKDKKPPYAPVYGYVKDPPPPKPATTNTGSKKLKK